VLLANRCEPSAGFLFSARMSKAGTAVEHGSIVGITESQAHPDECESPENTSSAALRSTNILDRFDLEEAAQQSSLGLSEATARRATARTVRSQLIERPGSQRCLAADGATAITPRARFADPRSTCLTEQNPCQPLPARKFLASVFRGCVRRWPGFLLARPSAGLLASNGGLCADHPRENILVVVQLSRR